jgi:hypothetical protein
MHCSEPGESVAVELLREDVAFALWRLGVSDLRFFDWFCVKSEWIETRQAIHSQD